MKPFFKRILRALGIGAKPESTTEEPRQAGDPYRTPAADESAHGRGCEGCEHLERIGARWKPPEMLLATGVPVTCVSHTTGISVEGLCKLAEEAGLVRQ